MQRNFSFESIYIRIHIICSIVLNQMIRVFSLPYFERIIVYSEQISLESFFFIKNGNLFWHWTCTRLKLQVAEKESPFFFTDYVGLWSFTDTESKYVQNRILCTSVFSPIKHVSSSIHQRIPQFTDDGRSKTKVHRIMQYVLKC